MIAESIENSSPAVPLCLRTGSDRRYHFSYHTDSEGQIFYSTVTDFARFLGWSTSHPRKTAM